MPYDVLDPTLAQPAPITSAGAPLLAADVDGSMSLGDIYEAIELSCGNRSDLAVGGAYRDQLLKWINWGYRHVAGMLDVKELWGSVEFTLIADQPFYAVPSALAWIKKMVIADSTDYPEWGGMELQQIDVDTYRTLPDSDEIQQSGGDFPPTRYFRYGRMIVVWPTPQSEFSAPVDFRVRVADMTDVDQCPLFGQEFHEPIMLAGLMRAQRMLGMRAKAQETKNDFVELIRPLINTDGEERVAMHMVAQPIHRKIQLYMGG